MTFKGFFLKVSFPIATFSLINALFVAKYTERIFPQWCFLLAIVSVVVYYFFAAIAVKKIATNRKICISAQVLSAILFVAMIAVQYFIDPMTLRVDRWSAIDGPLSYLFSGKYPYMAPTHLDGYASPFPIWQIFHIPFYLLGNVGLSHFVTFLFFVFAVGKNYGKQAATIVSLLLLTSVSVWYEAAVRSDLFANMFVVSGICIFLLQRINAEWLTRNAIATATAVALLTCTRLSALLPLAMLIFPFFIKIKWQRKMLMIATFVIVFSLTFLPLVIWDADAFFHFEYNPWSLQTRQGQPIDLLFYILLGIFLSLAWVKRSNTLFYINTAILMLVLIGCSFIHTMIRTNNYDLFSSAYDITYFSSALPFCFVVIATRANLAVGDNLSKNSHVVDN